MASKTEDNTTLLVIVALGGYLLYKQLSKRAGAQTINMPGIIRPSANAPVVATPSAAALANLPRGIRNNNPGNIKVSNNAWRGKIGNDGTFERFDSAVNGLRAAAILLRTYATQYGLDTVEKIGSRWAPTGSGEAGNASWAGGVSQYSGLGLTTPLNINSQPTMIALLRGIVAQENGAPYRGYYSDAVLAQAIGAM